MLIFPIGQTGPDSTTKVLFTLHTISLDGSLPSNFFLFQLCGDACQEANDHMLHERCIN
jgi:hypothetical protein